VRVTIGTPTLALVAALLVVVLVAVPVLAAAGGTRAATAVLFAFAPLVPVLGVVLAFRADTDPAGELSVATPLASIRLVLLRTAVVLAIAMPVGVFASALVPAPFGLVIGWLLPGLALCGIVLACSSRLDPARLGAVLAGGWAVAVGASFVRTRAVALDLALEAIFVNQELTQIVSALVVCAAAVFIALQRTEIRPRSSS
jgi:hypothetical protein